MLAGLAQLTRQRAARGRGGGGAWGPSLTCAGFSDGARRGRGASFSAAAAAARATGGRAGALGGGAVGPAAGPAPPAPPAPRAPSALLPHPAKLRAQGLRSPRSVFSRLRR